MLRAKTGKLLLAVKAYGRLDVRINNAGILGLRIPFLDYAARDWQEVLKVNLTGPFFTTKDSPQGMRNQGSGCIIYISSSVGRKGRAGWSTYAVSKFGVEGLTQVLVDELRSRGVCMISLHSGGTKTEMRFAAYPHGDPSTWLDPSAAATALCRLVQLATPSISGQAFDLHTLL